jgi:hypothetical protein
MEQSARTDVAWNQTAPQFTSASLSVKFPLSNDIVSNQSSEQTFPLLISVWHTDKSDDADAALSWQSLGVAECDALTILSNNGQRVSTSELPSAIVTLPLSERGSVCVRVDVVPMSVYLEQQSQSEMQLLSAKCSNSLSPAQVSCQFVWSSLSQFTLLFSVLQSRALWAQAISLAESSASIPPLALCLTFRLRVNSDPLASATYASAIANALHLPVALICANVRRKDTHHFVDVRIVPDPVQAVAFPTAAGFATTLKRSIDEQFVAGISPFFGFTFPIRYVSHGFFAFCCCQVSMDPSQHCLRALPVSTPHTVRTRGHWCSLRRLTGTCRSLKWPCQKSKPLLWPPLRLSFQRMLCQCLRLLKIPSL